MELSTDSFQVHCGATSLLDYPLPVPQMVTVEQAQLGGAPPNLIAIEGSPTGQ